MNNTVFFSWQSDLPNNIGRNFIHSSLVAALKVVNDKGVVEDSVRPSLEVDHDTKDVPGSPELVNTIFSKIDECSVFVPDLTFVSATADDVRRVSNPNVLIELGWAAKSVGFERFLPIQNVAFGRPEDHLPFDLRHRRFPLTYELPVDAPPEKRSSEKKQLISKIVQALGMFDFDISNQIESSDEAEQPVYLSSSFLNDGDILATSKDEYEDHVDYYWENGPQIFARLIPQSPVQPPMNQHRLRREISLLPLGQWRSARTDSNSHGAVSYNPRTSGTTNQLSQVFTSGELWGIERFGDDVVDRRGIPLPYVCQELSKALNTYSKILKDQLHIDPPHRAIVGLSGIEGFGLLQRNGNVRGTCYLPELICSGEVGNGEDIRALVQELWNLVEESCTGGV